MTAINNQEELEERLSRPNDADAAALAALDGDLLILGAGGKMGPTLAKLARRAADKAGVKKRVIAVARFSDTSLPAELAEQGIETVTADLLEPGELEKLPDIPNVIYMAAKKFGTSGAEPQTWAMNTYLPGLVASRFRGRRGKAAPMSRLLWLPSASMPSLRSAVSGYSNTPRRNGERRLSFCV